MATQGFCRLMIDMSPGCAIGAEMTVTAARPSIREAICWRCMTVDGERYVMR